MNIFFHDPDDIPLPPDEVHIREFAAKPYPDGRRVRVYLEISPFLKRPSAEITIHNGDGDIVASISIIETIDPRMEMTLHLRGPAPAGNYTARAELFYEEIPPLDENGHPAETPINIERTLIDRAETAFTIHH